MSKESLLKKEFKQSDVERARNLVKKDFTSKTKDQIGYQKKYVHRGEGDVFIKGSSAIEFVYAAPSRTYGWIV